MNAVKTPKRQSLTPVLATEWAQMAHALYLEALMTQTHWSSGELAFHGGTSLRLSWNSLRHSADLDFLLSRAVSNLDAAVRAIHIAMSEMARHIDPDFVIAVADKTKDAQRTASYMITVSHPRYVGVAKIKAEFWRTKPAYLKKYPTQMRTPQAQSASLDFYSLVHSPVPAASLETAYADKLTAFATRPYLKWRDLYDLWWIGTQTSAKLEMSTLCKQFLHNISAYTPLQELSPAQALALFLKNDKRQLVKLADPGIRNWLPASLWARMQPDGIRQMVDYVFHAIENVSAHIERGDRAKADLHSVPRGDGA